MMLEKYLDKKSIEQLKSSRKKAAILVWIGGFVFFSVILFASHQSQMMREEVQEKHSRLSKTIIELDKSNIELEETKNKTMMIEIELLELEFNKTRLETESKTLQLQKIEAADKVEKLDEQYKVMYDRYISIQKSIDDYKLNAVRKVLAPVEDVVIPKASAQSFGGHLNVFKCWLDVPLTRLNEITKVEWIFDHKTFKNKKMESKNKETGFLVQYKGWGALDNVGILIYTNEGEPKKLYFNMHKEVFKEEK